MMEGRLVPSVVAKLPPCTGRRASLGSHAMQPPIISKLGRFMLLEDALRGLCSLVIY